MTRIAQLKIEVGEWSAENFGDQPALNPLLGVGEELGEIAEATNEVEIIDGYADALIFLCDFCHRSGVKLEYIPVGVSDVITFRDLVATYGKILHIILKRSQGIRGFDNDDFYLQKLNVAVLDFIAHLNNSFEFEQKHRGSKDTCLLAATEVIWNTIVSKRDWANNPEGTLQLKDSSSN